MRAQIHEGETKRCEDPWLQRLCSWAYLYPTAVNVALPVLNQLALYQEPDWLELRIINMDPLSGSHLQAQSNSSLIPDTTPVLSYLCFPQQVPCSLAKIPLLFSYWMAQEVKGAKCCTVVSSYRPVPVS